MGLFLPTDVQNKAWHKLNLRRHDSIKKIICFDRYIIACDNLELTVSGLAVQSLIHIFVQVVKS